MKTKILIADDEADIVSMLRSFFESVLFPEGLLRNIRFIRQI